MREREGEGRGGGKLPQHLQCFNLKPSFPPWYYRARLWDSDVVVVAQLLFAAAASSNISARLEKHESGTKVGKKKKKKKTFISTWADYGTAARSAQFGTDEIRAVRTGETGSSIKHHHHSSRKKKEKFLAAAHKQRVWRSSGFESKMPSFPTPYFFYSLDVHFPTNYFFFFQKKNRLTPVVGWKLPQLRWAHPVSVVL